MAELMRNWNCLALQNSSFLPINYEDIACLRTKLHYKKSRSVMGICELNAVFMSITGYASFGSVEKLNKCQLSSVCGSTRMANSVASSEIRLSSEVDEDKDIQSGKDEIVSDSFEQNWPPWGNSTVQQEPEVDCESTVQPSVSGRNTISLNEGRVHLLEEMNEEGLSRRIVKLSRLNKVRSAVELFRSMEFLGLLPSGHACNSLISCLLRKQLFDYAMRVFEFMKRNGIATAHTYTLILKAVADMQGCESSLPMFAELGGFSGEDNDFDVIVYNTMISVCGRANYWIDTERIWTSMKEKGCHGTEITYSLVVCIFVRCGQNELAVNAYNEMDQNGIRPRDDTFQAIIGALSKEGKWHLALNVFQSMLNRGVMPNLIACNALMNSLGKAGEYKLAFQVFKKLKSLGHTPDAYTWNALLNGLYRANQLSDAIHLFEYINREQNSQINEHLYNTALMSCQKLGLWDKALQLLWQLEASELPVSTTPYNLVIGACEIARKPKVALQVYEHMIHQKLSPDTFTYLSLIRSCVWASLWGEVEEILEQVAPDASLYNAVIQGMCLKGKSESAKKLYMKMRRSELKPDGKTRAMMLQNLKKSATKRRR